MRSLGFRIWLAGWLVVVAKGDGTIFSIEDGEDQELDTEVVLTANVEISVEGPGSEDVYPVRISIEGASVRIAD